MSRGLHDYGSDPDAQTTAIILAVLLVVVITFCVCVAQFLNWWLPQ